MGLKAVYRPAVRLSSTGMVTAQPPANAQTAHSPGRVSLSPPPEKQEKGKFVKKPDTGKPIAGAKLPPPVLNKIAANPPDKPPVKMAAGWAQQVRQKLQGEKKAKAARKKADRADAAKVAARPAFVAPQAPFVPRVQLSGEKVTESKAHPINPLKIKAPKGSSQAPGKTMGPIIKAKDR